MVTKDTLFRPTKAEGKLSATDRAAREIIDTEAAARTKKTDALRAARLARDEAAKAATPVAAKSVAKKAKPAAR